MQYLLRGQVRQPEVGCAEVNALVLAVGISPGMKPSCQLMALAASLGHPGLLYFLEILLQDKPKAKF